MKRLFDIIFSILGILFCSPIFVFLFLAVIFDSKGGAFYKQIRVGRFNKNFRLIKFRTMRVGSDQKGLLTVGGLDSRITDVGFFIRKYKLDELPQLFNILKGDMSIVGPRPEVRKYVDMYSAEQMRVLDVRPGLTDYASIEYINESEILALAQDPEREYIDKIMPDKLSLNMKYIAETGLITDLKIIAKTFSKIVKS
ncbi:MAG: sugar transferase [Bacteroidales bacterium]|nr:sugar transferase [Bacteroidales bacterium]